ncbi:hypothetical protein PAXINDRAFT_86079, partial [Paxillus involutus ATCC 200175]
IYSEHNISHFHRFIEHVGLQLLRSNLGDLAIPGTGIELKLEHMPGRAMGASRTPHNLAQSAFGFLNTHQTRLDRADLGLRQQVKESEVPVPRFPRGVLGFELSNGCTTFSDIEFRSLAKLELGIMLLGYKVHSVCLLCVYAPALSGPSSLGNYPTPSSRLAL